MKPTKKELLEAADLLWNENIIGNALWKQIRSGINHSNNFCALDETQAVRQNEDAENVCLHLKEPILVNGFYECPDCGRYGEDC